MGTPAFSHSPFHLSHITQQGTFEGCCSLPRDDQSLGFYSQFVSECCQPKHLVRTATQQFLGGSRVFTVWPNQILMHESQSTLVSISVHLMAPSAMRKGTEHTILGLNNDMHLKINLQGIICLVLQLHLHNKLAETILVQNKLPVQ